MNDGERKSLAWPWVLAAITFLIPVVLFLVYPIGLWSFSDNETGGLAHALNLAYRIADFRKYPDYNLGQHPGVPFYLMSWMALAVSGHPVPGAAQHNFLRDVIDRVEDYHRAIVWMSALVAAAGAFVFARTALKLIPVGATIAALLLWLVATPATILFLISAGIESFAILINGLFLAILVRLAFDREIEPAVVVLAGCVGAFAYLNKLSYIYVPLALVSAIFWKACFCRIGWKRGTALIALSVFVFLALIAAIAYFVIGWDSFRDLLKFHRRVIVGAGLYGEGDKVIVDPEGIWRAITSVPGDKTYAIPLALIAGGTLCIAGLITGFRNRHKIDIAIVSIGVGLAALFSALTVVKHYEPHYTAGVSAALPACLVACCLFAQGWSFRLRRSALAIAWGAVLLMAGPVLLKVTNELARRSESTRLALEDIKEIRALTVGVKGVVDFAYPSPFREHGEGIVTYFAGVPRLTQEYLRDKGPVTNSMTEHVVSEEVGAYVIDKNYFADVAAVKSAANVDLLGPKPVRVEADDRLIELRTVFLLIRK